MTAPARVVVRRGASRRFTVAVGLVAHLGERLDGTSQCGILEVMATYQNTKAKGNSAELEVLCFFNRKGYVVSLPFGDNAPYDLILESPSAKVYRVQVRWSSWKGDVLMVNLQRSSQGRSYPLDLTRIDTFVAWDGTKLYIVPVQKLAHCKAGFSLRRSETKNGQSKGINLASDFFEALHLVP